MAKPPSEKDMRDKIRQDAHRAKVKANEDEVIKGAQELDATDHSPEAEHIRDTAEDIQMRRAGLDQYDID